MIHATYHTYGWYFMDRSILKAPRTLARSFDSQIVCLSMQTSILRCHLCYNADERPSDRDRLHCACFFGLQENGGWRRNCARRYPALRNAEKRQRVHVAGSCRHRLCKRKPTNAEVACSRQRVAELELIQLRASQIQHSMSKTYAVTEEQTSPTIQKEIHVTGHRIHDQETTQPTREYRSMDET